MSPRIFFSVLLVIIGGWIAAGAYTVSQQLDQPVFLDHYIENYAYEGLQMQFYYLTNKGDNNAVNFVTLGDIPAYTDGFHEMFMGGTPAIEQYGTRELRSVNFSLDPHELNKLNETTVINEITVYLSGGESFVADIGEIIIHPDKRSAASYLSQNSSSMSGEWSISYLQAEEDISILGLEPQLPDAVVKNLKVHVPRSAETIFSEYNYVQKIEEGLDDGGGEDLQNVEYPVTLDKGKSMAISIQNNEGIDFVLNLRMIFEGEDKSGSAIKLPVYLNFTPELSGKKVKAIIEQKEGRDK